MRFREFYADANRVSSREIDVGLTWRYAGIGLWKLVWLEGTGELVAFNEGSSSSRDIGGGFGGGGHGGSAGEMVVDLALEVGFEAALDAGIRAADRGIDRLLHHHDEPGHGPGHQHKIVPNALREDVCVMCVERDRKRLRETLHGWQEQVGDANGLAWVAARCGTNL